MSVINLDNYDFPLELEREIAKFADYYKSFGGTE
jgi:hypothetical protein